MTGGTWLAVAVALACVPLAHPSAGRARSLRNRGRLSADDRVTGLGRLRRFRSPTTAAVLALGATGLAVAAPLPWGTAVGVVGAAAAVLTRRLRARRRATVLRDDLRTALRILAAELEAGGRPSQALLAAGRAAPRHRPLFEQAAQASTSGGAAAAFFDDESTRGLACAWRVAEDAGASLASVVARVAADLDAAVEQDHRVGVALAGPRASAAVLAGLPLLGVALGIAMGADPVRFLLRTPSGSIVGALGVVLDVAGVLWVERIVRRASS